MSVHLLAGQSCLEYFKNWENVFSLQMVSYNIFKEPRSFWPMTDVEHSTNCIDCNCSRLGHIGSTRVTQIREISLMNLDPTNWWL